MAGKGSKQRPTDINKLVSNWDLIDWSKKKKVEQPPVVTGNGVTAVRVPIEELYKALDKLSQQHSDRLDAAGIQPQTTEEKISHNEKD